MHLHIVTTWALKGSPYHDFGASVCTIEILGPFGCKDYKLSQARFLAPYFKLVAQLETLSFVSRRVQVPRYGGSRSQVQVLYSKGCRDLISSSSGTSTFWVPDVVF